MRQVAGMAMMAVLLTTGTASAQVAPPLEDLQVRPGAKVAVTDEHGNKITGRFVRLDPQRITIGGDGEMRHVPVEQILRIEEVDDLRNGLLIGLGIGATLFIVEAVAAHADGFELSASGYAVIGSIYAGLGAGVGAGIDALVGGNKAIYRRGATPGVVVAPTVRPGLVGVGVAFSW